MIAHRRSRWALSFADISLLLLGFFILMQASTKGREAVVSGVGTYFGASPSRLRTDLPAAQLFEPGEAILTDAGTARLAAMARRAVANGQHLDLISRGRDRGARRFDAWDLAAARLGAVARALEQSGVAEDHLAIRGLDEQSGDGKGQVIGVVPRKAR